MFSCHNTVRAQRQGQESRRHDRWNQHSRQMGGGEPGARSLQEEGKGASNYFPAAVEQFAGLNSFMDVAGE